MARMDIEELATRLKKPGLLAEDGMIYTCLEQPFKERLSAYLATFESIREQEGKRIHDPARLLELPYGLPGFDWQLRKQSLAVIRHLLEGKRFGSILEISGWNGWLSKYLAGYTDKLVVLDYFSDPCDGLKAVQYYPEPWTAIQCNLSDPFIFKATFDVVVLNHSLPYTEEPVRLARRLREMLSPGGMAILLGLPFFKNPGTKIRDLENMKTLYMEKHGINIFINPVKGWLGCDDKDGLIEAGYTLFPYPGLWKQKLKARLRASSPEFLFATTTS